MPSEKAIMHDIMLAVSKAGHRVWRNNVGVATTRDGSVIRFGLAVGSSDLIGVTKDGRFLAIECKTDSGRATDEQLNFISLVRSMGGRAGIARSISDAFTIIEGLQ
ncbi:MAG TPA: VRR-NUC domain-containing protein [Methylophilaceae bacterium]|nr:VRR-NUC domain-containing protein [Methylophilaceae bacterium]